MVDSGECIYQIRVLFDFNPPRSISDSIFHLKSFTWRGGSRGAALLACSLPVSLRTGHYVVVRILFYHISFLCAHLALPKSLLYVYLAITDLYL